MFFLYVLNYIDNQLLYVFVIQYLYVFICLFIKLPCAKLFCDEFINIRLGRDDKLKLVNNIRIVIICATYYTDLLKILINKNAKTNISIVCVMVSVLPYIKHTFFPKNVNTIFNCTFVSHGEPTCVYFLYINI